MSEPKFVRCNECRAFNEPRALFCSRCGASLYGPAHGGVRRKHRRVTAAGLAMGTALLLALAVITFIFVTIIMRGLDKGEEIDPYRGLTGTPATVSTSVTQTGSGADGGATSTTLAPVQIRPSSAASSSYLKSKSTTSYRATNLLDGDLATAWEEGAEGPGLGEWVRLEFNDPLVIARLEIANGCQKDEDRFNGNPRVRSLKVEYSDGTTQLVELEDVTDFQTITATVGPVEWVKLVVVSVYAGDRWEDTALSEVRVYEAVR
ncbi:MAG: discoidin domain-containing protein [Thermoleophilia bacterium]|nr:discoidin domain-containing protein [Thermoleophilia bacterium]